MSAAAASTTASTTASDSLIMHVCQRQALFHTKTMILTTTDGKVRTVVGAASVFAAVSSHTRQSFWKKRLQVHSDSLLIQTLGIQTFLQFYFHRLCVTQPPAYQAFILKLENRALKKKKKKIKTSLSYSSSFLRKYNSFVLLFMNKSPDPHRFPYDG